MPDFPGTTAWWTIAGCVVEQRTEAGFPPRVRHFTANAVFSAAIARAHLQSPFSLKLRNKAPVLEV